MTEEEKKEQEKERQEKAKREALKARTQLVSFSKEKIRKIFRKAIANEKEIKEKSKKEKEIACNNLEDDSPTPDKRKQKKRSLSIILLFLFVFAVFLSEDEDEEGKKFEPRYAKLPFPVQIDEDIERSELFFKNGLKKYLQNDYESRVLAANEFKQAVELNVKNQSAMGHLIMAYAELLESAEDKKKSSYTVFKLIRINRNKLLTDVNFAIGSAVFYKQIKKFKTAQNVIENYLRIGRPSLKLLAHYLMILIQQGNLEQGRKVFKKIKNEKDKSLESYLAMAKFYEINQEFENGKKVLEEGSKKFKNSVPLLLGYGKYILEEQKFKELAKILMVVKKLKAELNPVYYAKYLEYKGILMASQGKNGVATRLFQLALKINESDELRSKLAALELGGDQAVEALVIESKVINLMKKSREERQKRNWELAFRFAIDAVDLSPTYIPAQILLAKIQVDRGYFNSALETLIKLYKLHPLNTKINFLLLRAYTKAYKLDKVREHIATMLNSEFSRTAEYASALAQYYVRGNNFLLAIRWFQEAIKRDPLNDSYYFLLAKILLKYRKYDKGKIMLTKAIDLNPENVYYRSEYAKILYELGSVETAIGHLRDILEKYPENPKILGEIATYYYRSGQIKDFKKYKIKVQNLLNKDLGFYEFLIKAAILEGDTDKAIEYSKELLKIKPGDLDIKIALGEYYYQKNDFENAIRELEEIKKNLPSYPKVNYFLAKIYIKKGKYQEALKFGKEEAKLNPSSGDGHYIIGEVSRLMQNYPEAIRNLEKAISLKGNFLEALIALAWIKHKQNYLDTARQFYQKALKLDQNNAIVHRELGHVYRNIGQSSLAIESFRSYLALSPRAKDRARIEKIMRQLK